jgi:hypothetical protein
MKFTLPLSNKNYTILKLEDKTLGPILYILYFYVIWKG